MARVGKVYLVGAGPGDPELITARGLRRLRQADLVLYDALVHPDQLAECKPDAELVFVGKREGRVGERQSEINRRMLEAARSGQSVVRLKGGDPYLFGRGSEEAEFLAAQGIAFEVVPGVPSPLAATAYAGISLTHRELASSVAYITATESVDKDRSSHDWAKLATATQTLVIFMGMRKLDTLMELLIEHGRPADTPVAVIHWASLPRQRTVVGTIANIHERVVEAKLGRPVLTIVGDVVGLRNALRWFDTKPLFGKRVLVTRATHQARSVARLLRDEGAQPIVAPTIQIEPPGDIEPVRESVRALDRYDWVVFTSANSVSALWDVLREEERDPRAFAGARICAIGPRTHQALTARGVRPDLVPSASRAEGVAAALLEHAKTGARVLLPRAEVGREFLPDTLRRAGVEVDVVAVYRTVAPSAEQAARILDIVHPEELDAVLFTSSSTVNHLCDVLGSAAPDVLNRLVLASIGPVTTDTAKERGLHIAVEAKETTIQNLVESLRTYYDDEQA